MEITDWYRQNLEQDLKGRYISLAHISPLLENYKKDFDISIAGYSEKGKAIPLVKIGNGDKVVLAWSQMHGNESTTTKAIFDFFKFINLGGLFPKEVDDFLTDYSFYILPILNPDGAENYTRENINGKDLNRDAEALSQKESQVLRKVFDACKPILCLNLHDQRSIYGFEDGNSAVISFLSPAADSDRTLTPSRIIAMQHIVRMNEFLQKILPGQVGRYDDTFNPACVGDCFTQKGAATILFEAGHYLDDYNREKTREFIFYALLALFGFTGNTSKNTIFKDYFAIPENLQNYKDVILRNVKAKDSEENISIAIQYCEVLKNGLIEFLPVVQDVGVLQNIFGHKEVDMEGRSILINSATKLKIGTEISQIIDKTDGNAVIFR